MTNRDQRIENVREALSSFSSKVHIAQEEELIDLAQAANESFEELIRDPFSEALYQVENGWIETYTGKAFYLREPDLDSICIEDIAHSFENQCRYNGHVKRFYCVAEHSSILAAYVFNQTQGGKRISRTMLLHDAAEAYIGDLPRPLKRMLPEFVEIERRIFKAIAEKFDIFEELPPYIKELDSRILVDERKSCMNPSSNVWGTDSLVPLNYAIASLPPDDAEKVFLQVFSMVQESA